MFFNNLFERRNHEAYNAPICEFSAKPDNPRLSYWQLKKFSRPFCGGTL